MVIATAATTAAVSSATDDKGIINQGFKLAVLIGLALAIATGIFLIYTITNVFQPLLNLLENGGTVARVFFSLTPLGGITSGITYLLSGAFGRN